MDATRLRTLFLLLLAGCSFPEQAKSPREPRPETAPAAEPNPAPAPASEPVPEVVPRDNCLGCGMGFVPELGKAFLDAYSAQKA